MDEEKLKVFTDELNTFMNNLDRHILKQISEFALNHMDIVSENEVLMKIFTIYIDLGKFISRTWNEDNLVPIEVLYRMICDEDASIEMQLVPDKGDGMVM
jgi:hypothetical protein